MKKNTVLKYCRQIWGFKMPRESKKCLACSHLTIPSKPFIFLLDLRGCVLKVFKGEYGRGMHQIQLDGEDLPAGVLQYTLISGDFTATRKMVLTR